jgi:large repetitive protein
VTFKNGAATLGTGTLGPTGMATLNTSVLPLGMLSLTASYGGDSDDYTSTGSLGLTVNQAQIMMMLSSSPNPSSSGKTVTFTATLTSNGGLPTGQAVTFSYNGTTLGKGTVSASGLAVFSTKTLPAGSDTVTATYAGDLHYSEASAQTTQNVN